ncbi:alpha/beta hydrolase [Brevundimonas sp. LjRoot202]|uniref:alpha/beta hydrolase n=1 Tax=Brevundimonas sp. LjRoot202 TaxID=3342281 RepID=UPI003ECE1256
MRLLIGLLWLLSLSTPVSAQAIDPARRADGASPETPAALRGDYFYIRSDEIGRGYHIHVRYPEGYGPAAERTWPTVYLTDGDSLFPILAANHLFLHYDDGLPEALVVGIAYGGFDPSVNRRNIDFQSPGAGVEPSRAGAAAFQRFLKADLIPLIERRYRSDPTRRVLFGQSRGGAFVLYSAVTDPDLFWGRIASNPSVTPGLESLVETAAPSGQPNLGLVVVSGTRDRADLQAEAAQWLSEWEARPEKPWRLFGVMLDGGTHAADAPAAYRLGMNWLFGPDPAP